jgi:hypothetical protein
MQIDLNKKDLEMLFQGLDAWADLPMEEQIWESLETTILAGPGQSVEVVKARVAQARKTGTEKKKLRENEVILLKAKLLQAQTRAEEHDVPEHH